MSGSDKMHGLHDRWGRLVNIDVCAETEPAQTWPYMLWLQVSTATLKVRNAQNTAWVAIQGATGLHAATHEDGGSDEIDVTGLSGKLADPQDAEELQGRDIATTAPSDGDVLAWIAAQSKWTPTPPGGWPFSNVFTVDPSDPDADYTTVGAGISGISPGDVLELGASTSAYTFSGSIEKMCTIRGMGQPGYEGNDPVTVSLSFQSLVSLAETIHFQNLQISGPCRVDGGYIVFENCVIIVPYEGIWMTCTSYGPSTGRVIFRNCEFVGETGTIMDLDYTTRTIELYNCRVLTSGATTLDHGNNPLHIDDFCWGSNLTIAGAGTRINIGQPIAQAGVAASLPASPFFDGQFYYATDTNTLYIGDGGSWVIIGGAPLGAQYLVLALDGTLTDERRFVDGDGLTGTDGGAGADYTLDVDATVVRTSGAQTIAGVKTFSDSIMIASGKDVFTNDDEAGCARRLGNWLLDPVEDFDQSDFEWLTTAWAPVSAIFAGTPDGLDFGSTQSCVVITDSVQNDFFFRYRSISDPLGVSWNMFMRLNNVWGSDVAVRIDAGSNANENDFAELIVRHTEGTTYLDIVRRYNENGAGIITTTLVTGIPIGPVIIRMNAGSANVMYLYYGYGDTPYNRVASLGANAGDLDQWGAAAARVGISCKRTSPSAGRAAVIDMFHANGFSFP